MSLKFFTMPTASALRSLNYREHKACKSEGFLKPVSESDFQKSFAFETKNFSFFNNSLVFVNSKRLTNTNYSIPHIHPLALRLVLPSTKSDLYMHL